MNEPSKARRGVLLALLSLPMLALLTLPVVGLATAAGGAGVWRAIGERPAVQAMVLSLATSGFALALAVAMGTPLAYLLARRRFRGAAIVEALVDLPTIIPPAVAGVALLLTFGRRSTIGAALESAGLSLAFTAGAVVVAQVFVSAPYYIRAARAGFAGVDDDLLKAAAIDGASGWQRFVKVALPGAWPALAAGAALSWGRALGEFGATMIFAGNAQGRTQTMPLAVYMGFELEFERALALATAMLAVALALLVGVRLVGRSTGQ